jgi:hypothetical protein
VFRRVGVAACLALALVAGGCGTATIDGRSAAAQVSRTVGRRFGVGIPSARCPASVPAVPGRHFSCVAVVDGQPLDVRAQVTSRTGAFRISPGATVVALAATERAVARGLSRQVRRPVTVACPGQPQLIVTRAGRSLACQARIGTVERSVEVTFADDRGRFSYSLGAGG